MTNSHFTKRGKTLLVSLLVSLFCVTTATADDITVSDGTNTNDYVPFYGNWGDAFQKCEFIIPASDLATVSGKSLTALKFYSNTASVNWTGTFKVFLKEVSDVTMTAFQGTEGATVVFEGNGLGVSASKEMEITFTNNYTYNGGNLLVGIYQTTGGNYKSMKFYGVGQGSNTAWQGYSSSSLDAIGGSAKAFIPKTTFTYEDVATGPALAVYDGTTKLTSAYTYNFGLATAGTTKTFSVKNPGTEAVTISASATAGFGAELAATTVAAKGETTLTVTMPDATATGTVIVSTTASGVDPVEFTVSGTIRDANKVFIDFADEPMPGTWTMDNGWSVSSAGYATINYASYSGGYVGSYIRSGVVESEGENILFRYARNYNSSFGASDLKVYWATTGNGSDADWTEATGTTPEFEYNVWKDATYFIPAEAKYIAIYGVYVNVDDFYGLKEPNEPNMEFTAADYNFGMISGATESAPFTVKNTGKGELTGLSVQSDNAAFTVAVDGNATTIDGKSEVSFTVTLAADTKGAQSGVITVAADGFDAQTFNVSGYVLDDDALLITFDDNAKPENWENTGWTFSGGVATGNYTSGTSSRNSEMVTPSLTIAEGDVMAIEAKGNSSYAELKVYTSTTGNDGDWTLAKDFNTVMRANTSAYTIVYVDGIAAGSYKLKFEGYSVSVNTINGFQLNANAPALTVTPADAAAFGRVKAQPAAKTYTVENSGTGTLGGTIESDNEAFTVSESAFSLGAGESMTFDINLVFDDNYGEKSATITVHPTTVGLSDVTIAATATTADPELWEEDFEEGAIPATWTNDGWTASTSNYGNNGTYMAYAGTTAGTTLITPRLLATEGQSLSFYVGNGTDSSDQLTVEYSNDRTTWTAIDGSPITAAGTYTFTAPADGYYYLRFQGRYAGLDNFAGFKEAPADHDVTITAVSIPATGNQYVEYTASVTVEEKAGKEETLTAKFFIGEAQYGSDAVETLEANGTKTFTVTFTPDAAASGDAYFTLANEDLSLVTEKAAVTVAEALVLDETTAATLTDGTAASVVVKYTAKAGWNTITMPFPMDGDDLTAIFGEGWKAYELKGFNQNALSFKESTAFYAGYAYIVYTEAPANNTLYKQNVNITAATKNDQYTDTETGTQVTFYGTYAPMGAGEMEGKYGLTSDGRIAKGSASATMKGYRGYIQFSEEVSGIRIMLPDGEITTGIDAANILGNATGIYNLQGQRTNAAAKGVYIIGSRKVLK